MQNYYRREHVFLGTARGIHNLTKALEDAGKGRQVDWRKAYEEMSLFYQNQTSTDDQETLGTCKK